MSCSGALYALTNVANTFTQPQTIISPAIGSTPLTIQGFAGQSANFLTIQDSTAALIAKVNQNGTISTIGGVVGASYVESNQDLFTADLATISSANTIAPTTAAANVSGTTTIKTITPTAQMTGAGSGVIILVPTGLWITDITGNIALATVAVLNKPLTLLYSVATGKWYPSY